jgi:hypothetical protein
MRPHVPALLGACLLIASVAAAQAPLYTNVEIVSVDTRNGAIMVRTNEGQARLLKVEPHVSVDGLRRGDEVIVALRGASGSDRVTRILRRPGASPDTTITARGARGTTSATAVQGTTAATAVMPEDASARQAALEAFTNRVAVLADRAVTVDATWSTFANACAATVASPRDRDWFLLWEPGAVRADLSTGTCRELYNQLIARGEQVKAAMAAAEERAREDAVLPGEMRDIRSRFAMDWDGWDRPSPPRQTP